jgi:bla regulator protein BlaR1
MPRTILSRKYLRCVIVALGFVRYGCIAQVVAAAPTVETGTAPAKAMAFEVVSIRPSDPHSTMHGLKITPDGYRMLNAPLLWQIMDAYPPQTDAAAAFTIDKVKGYPAWLTTEKYDIEAKIAETDQAEWQKPASQPAMLRAMTRQMFAERCHLKVHREVKQGAAYSLVVGKDGPKLKVSDPNEVPPFGRSLSGGGVLVYDQAKGTTTVYGATIQSFLGVLASLGNGERPIEDNTGLTGRYDFTDKSEESSANSSTNQQQAEAIASDPEPSLSSFAKKLGLELVPTTGPVETLVIDHIERPSSN